jgi:Protein of unknown function (DUF3108)
MAKPLPTELAPIASYSEKSGFADLRARPALWIALALSIAVHIAWSLWPVEPTVAPNEVVLTATLTEMPAPPAPSVTAEPAPKKPPRPRPKRPPAPKPKQEPAAQPDTTARADVEPLPQIGPAEDAPMAAMAPAPSVEPTLLPPPWKTLPPRLDLAYKVFLGTHGFLIGEATYRFEHHGSEYRISTVAEARGLVALIVRGQGKVESRGVITPGGLLPAEFAVERGSSDRREVARFDWDAGVVKLHEDREATLESPAFDPLTLMWQAYFTPPEAALQTLNLVTTRRVLNYTITREGTEKIAWTHGEVDTERWHRKSQDGRVDAWFWIAPDMHYALVKMRVTQTARGTVEALLDAIRVDPPRTE